jgi:hypothetical protein
VGVIRRFASRAAERPSALAEIAGRFDIAAPIKRKQSRTHVAMK